MSGLQAQYTPGPYVAIGTPRLWCLFELGVDDPRVGGLWQAATSGADDVLDLMVREGLRNLPGFAILEHTADGIRCLVREPIGVRAGARPDDLDAVDAGSAAWSERLLPLGTMFVRIGPKESRTGPALPTSGGINLASSLTLEWGGGAPVVIPATSVTHAETEVPVTVAETEPQTEAEQEVRLEVSSVSEDPADHSEEYYRLLVSSTSDLAALRLRLADGASAEGESGSTAPGPSEPSATEIGATGIWRGDAEVDQSEPSQHTELEVEPELPNEPIVPVDTGVIDGLPWAPGAAPAPVPSARPVKAHTPLPRPPSRVVPPPSPPTPPDIATPAEATAVTTSRAALLRQLAEDHPVGPTVLAVQCGRGHLSPPYAATCRVCGAQLPEQTPVEVPRPTLGQLVLSTGTSVLLDKGVIFGRAPHSEIEDAAERPNLVRLVESGEISRMHTSVSIEGWQVLLRDLGSQNGTFLTVPGGEPQQLRSREDYQLEPGSVVSIADVVTFTFEVSG